MPAESNQAIISFTTLHRYYEYMDGIWDGLRVQVVELSWLFSAVPFTSRRFLRQLPLHHDVTVELPYRGHGLPGHGSSVLPKAHELAELAYGDRQDFPKAPPFLFPSASWPPPYGKCYSDGKEAAPYRPRVLTPWHRPHLA